MSTIADKRPPSSLLMANDQITLVIAASILTYFSVVQVDTGYDYDRTQNPLIMYMASATVPGFVNFVCDLHAKLEGLTFVTIYVGRHVR
jgi:hypothetical protein